MSRYSQLYIERGTRIGDSPRARRNQPAIDAGVQLLQGMKQWINALQPYRHGQEVEEPAEPPQEFVVAFLSSGATYLRWLMEVAS